MADGRGGEDVGVSGGGVEVVSPRGVDVKEIGDGKGLGGNDGRIRLLAPVLLGDIWQSHANSRREMHRREFDCMYMFITSTQWNRPASLASKGAESVRSFC